MHGGLCVSPLLASGLLVLFFSMLHKFLVDLEHCEGKILRGMEDSYVFFWKEYRIPADHFDPTEAWFKALLDLVYFRFALTSETLTLFVGCGHYS